MNRADKTAKLALFDRPIAFHRSFLRLGVGTTGALLLSQAVYWSQRTSDPNGWFYKSMAEWEEEIGLSPGEQATARKRLVGAGVLQEKRQGIPCRLYFRVDIDALLHKLLEAMPSPATMAADLPETDENTPETTEIDSFGETPKLDSAKPKNKTRGNPKTRSRKSQKLDSGKPENMPSETPKAITETTAETTAEITADSFAGGDADAPPRKAVGQLVEDDAQPRVDIPEDMPGPKNPTCRTYRPWCNYAMVYHKRYGVYPIWNRTVGGMLASIIDRIGMDEALRVVPYYVTINDALYIRRAHDLGTLLRDIQSVRTQYLTGRQMNATTARQIEATQANLNAVQELATQHPEPVIGGANAFLQ